MLRRLAWYVAGLVTGTLLLLAASVWATEYTWTTLDVPFAGASDTCVSGINNRG